MKKKLIILVTIYYTSMVVSSCCQGRLFFEISYNETVVSRLANRYNPTYIISAVNPKSESGFLNGSIAKIKGFKSALATSKCPEDVYVFKHVITSIKITSSNDYDTLFTAGSSLNDLFKIELSRNIYLDEHTQNYYSNEYYFIYRDATLAKIELINPIDSINIIDLYFEYNFDNQEIHKDTLLSQNLGRAEVNL